MCPSCGKLVGLDRVCPYCGKDTGSVGARVQRLAKAGQGGIAVTVGLVIANILVYALVVAVGGQEPADSGMELMRPSFETLLRLGLQHPALVAEGEWWRLVMPIFLHLGLLHLVMNTLVLWLTGRHLEADIGSPAFFFMYIAAGVVGFAGSQVAGIGGGGASGAVAGVLGCIIVKRRLSDGHFRDPVTLQAIQLVVLNAIFGLIVSRVNNVAHLGGLLTGAALGFVFAKTEGLAWAKRVWLGAAGVSLAVVIASVVLMLQWKVPLELVSPDSREARAQRALACVRIVADALEDNSMSMPPREAQVALRCIDDAGPIEPELDRAMATLRDGLKRVYEGRTNGSLAGEREGAARIEEGIRGINKWWRAQAATEPE